MRLLNRLALPVLAAAGISVAALTAQPSTANTPTPVCGNITANTTWEGARKLTCNIAINSGVTLTLAPGATLDTNAYGITIYGQLDAQEDNRIWTSRTAGRLTLASSSGATATLNDTEVTSTLITANTGTTLNVGEFTSLTGSTVTVTQDATSALHNLVATNTTLDLTGADLTNSVLQDSTLNLKDHPTAPRIPAVTGNTISGNSNLKATGPISLDEVHTNNFGAVANTHGVLTTVGEVILTGNTNLAGLKTIGLSGSTSTLKLTGTPNIDGVKILTTATSGRGTITTSSSPDITLQNAVVDKVNFQPGTGSTLTVKNTPTTGSVLGVGSGATIFENSPLTDNTLSGGSGLLTIKNSPITRLPALNRPGGLAIFDSTITDSGITSAKSMLNLQRNTLINTPITIDQAALNSPAPIVKDNILAGNGTLSVITSKSTYPVDFSNIADNTFSDGQTLPVATTAQKTITVTGDGYLHLTGTTDLGAFQTLNTRWDNRLTVAGTPTLPANINTTGWGQGITYRARLAAQDQNAVVQNTTLHGIEITPLGNARDKDVTVENSTLNDSWVWRRTGVNSTIGLHILNSTLNDSLVSTRNFGFTLSNNQLNNTDVTIEHYTDSTTWKPTVKDNTFSGDGSLNLHSQYLNSVLDLTNFTGNIVGPTASSAQKTIAGTGSGYIHLPDTTNLEAFETFTLTSNTKLTVEGEANLPQNIVSSGRTYQYVLRPTLAALNAPATLTGKTLNGIKVTNLSKPQDSNLTIQSSTLIDSYLETTQNGVSISVKESTVKDSTATATSKPLVLVGNDLINTHVSYRNSTNATTYTPTMRGNTFAGNGSVTLHSSYLTHIVDTSSIYNNNSASIDQVSALTGQPLPEATNQQLTLLVTGGGRIHNTGTSNLSNFTIASLDKDTYWTVEGTPGSPQKIQTTGWQPGSSYMAFLNAQIEPGVLTNTKLYGVKVAGLNTANDKKLTIQNSVIDNSLVGHKVGTTPIEVVDSVITKSVLSTRGLYSHLSWSLKVQNNTIHDSEITWFSTRDEYYAPTLIGNTLTGVNKITFNPSEDSSIVLGDVRDNQSATPAQNSITLTGIGEVAAVDTTTFTGFGSINFTLATDFALGYLANQPVHLENIHLKGGEHWGEMIVRTPDASFENVVVDNVRITDQTSYDSTGTPYAPALTTTDTNFVRSDLTFDDLNSKLKLREGTRFYIGHDKVGVSLNNDMKFTSYGKENNPVVFTSECDPLIPADTWWYKSANCIPDADGNIGRPVAGVQTQRIGFLNPAVHVEETVFAYVKTGVSVSGVSVATEVLSSMAFPTVLDFSLGDYITNSDFIDTDKAATLDVAWIDTAPVCMYGAYMPLNSSYFGPNHTPHLPNFGSVGTAVVEKLLGNQAKALMRNHSAEVAEDVRAQMNLIDEKAGELYAALEKQTQKEREDAIETVIGTGTSLVTTTTAGGQAFDEFTTLDFSRFTEKQNTLDFNLEYCSITVPGGKIPVPMMNVPLTSPVLLLGRDTEPNTAYANDLLTARGESTTAPIYLPAVGQTFSPMASMVGIPLDLLQLAADAAGISVTDQIETPAPTGLQSAITAPGAVKLTWDPSVLEAKYFEGYKVSYTVDGQTYDYKDGIILDHPTVTIKGLDPSKVHTFEVSAVSVDGTGPASTLPVMPTTPMPLGYGDVGAELDSAGRATVTWDFAERGPASLTPAANWQVRWQAVPIDDQENSDQQWHTTGWLEFATGSHSLNYTEDHIITLQVRGINGAGYGAWSTSATVVTPG